MIVLSYLISINATQYEKLNKYPYVSCKNNVLYNYYCCFYSEHLKKEVRSKLLFLANF